MSTFLLKNIGELVTCSGGVKRGKDMNNIGVVKDACIYSVNGIIEYVGTMKDMELEYFEADKVIDAKGSCVLPGFVDSHTHFLFAGFREDEFQWRAGGLPYMEIHKRGGGIQKSVEATRSATEEELFTIGLERLKNMMAMGITTVEGKSGYGLDLETELKQLKVMKDLNAHSSQDIVTTFLGAHSIPKEYKNKNEGGREYITYIINEVLPKVKENNLAEFCDVFCETGVFSVEESKALLNAAKKMGLKLKIHADEITTLGGAELACELGAFSADHLLKISNEGIKQLSKCDTVATLLPLTAFSLKEPYARARDLIDSGAIVALASDFNPGSCFSYSVPLLFSLAVLYLGMTIEEAISAFTINGAKAIDKDKRVGSLEKGKVFDAVILKYPSYNFLPYHVGINIVDKVIKNGRLD